MLKNKVNVTITDIRPGLIDIDMAIGEELFGVQSPQKVENRIYLNKIK